MPYLVQWGVRRAVLIVGTALLLTLAAVATAAATTLTVTTTKDVNDGSCTASQCSLRDAIVAADGVSGATTVVVPAGTYTLTIPSAGADDPTTGDLDINNGTDVTLTGAGSSSTVINAGGSYNYFTGTPSGDRVFAVQKAGGLSLSGVTLENGVPSEQSSGDVNGGAIWNDGSLTITGDAKFENNDALQGAGGAIFSGQDGTLSVTGATFESNTAYGDTVIGAQQAFIGGGAIAAVGAASITDSTFKANAAETVGGAIGDAGTTGATGPLSIQGSTFDGNIGELGGAVADAGPGTMNVSHSSFSDNTAEIGGAATNTDEYVNGIYDAFSPQVSFTDDTFTGNTAAEGGALALLGNPLTATTGTATLTGDEFDDNSSLSSIYGIAAYLDFEEDGGAMLAGLENVDVDGSSFVGNTSGQGGAISSNGSIISMTNATVSGNTATRGGGIELLAPYYAIYFFGLQGQQYPSVLSLDNSTIAHNTASIAGGGGGIDGTVDMTTGLTGVTGPTGQSGPTGVVNSIVGANAGGDCATGENVTGQTGISGASEVPVALDLGHNLDSDGSCFGSTGATGTPQASGDLVDVNPKLGPAMSNGGPVQTDALLPGSPAIDAAAGGPFCPLADARGVSRPQGAACDIGAYEMQASAIGLSGSVPQTASQSVPFDATATVASNGPGLSTNTMLTAKLPANTTLYSVSNSQGTCTQSGTPATVNCTLGNIAGGSPATVTLVLAGGQVGTVQTTMSASNDEGSTATATTSTQVVAAVGPPVPVPTATTGPTGPARSRGSLLVRALVLRVHKGRVTVPFDCDSTSACRGHYSLTVHARLAHGNGTATIGCTKAKQSYYRIGAGKTKTVSSGLTASCMSLVHAAHGTGMWAKISSDPRTGQASLIKVVSLTASAAGKHSLKDLSGPFAALLGP